MTILPFGVSLHVRPAIAGDVVFFFEYRWTGENPRIVVFPGHAYPAGIPAETVVQTIDRFVRLYWGNRPYANLQPLRR
jgi:hypothetical protein